MIGQRLDSYEITAKLGEGGMGEVYRAHDTKLKRDVAIKVLPAAFTEDKERLARFEREAQLLAQLNHPNIAAIYALEKWGQLPISGIGSDSSKAEEKSETVPISALVMELVEGPTLADRLEHGPLPSTESLSISLQIAQALEEAHEKGIVHRDLKPQNVKASIEGKVKVLDFGLAKAMDPAGTASGSGASASQLAKSPTLTMGATQMGVILGTAAYMSPEQAKGMAVDKRSDIWAFGVVLYEMLVGGSLFSGDSVGDTLAAVIRAEIDLGKLPAEIPPAIRRLLRRCLERNPKNRLHDIADARIVLEEVLRGERDELTAAPVAAPALPPARGWQLPAAVAATAAIALAAGWLLRPVPSVAPLALRLALSTPTGYAISDLSDPGLALSADGRRQVVTLADAAGRTQLYLRDLRELEPRLVAGTEGASAPVLSPDGDWLAFVLDGKLRKAAIAGGPSTQLSDASTGGDFRGASWSSDGFIYFSPGTSNPIFRISENGGPATAVTRLDTERQERTHRWPEVLPDGSAVLFTSDTTESTEYYDDARIEAVQVATGERKVVLEESSQARFLAPDHLLFARGGTLFAIRFDAAALATVGAAVPIVQGVSTDVGSGAVRFATAASGAAVWVPGDSTVADRQLVWGGLGSAERSLGLPPDRYSQFALAPDGRRLAATLDGLSSTDLWMFDLERGTKSRLTFAGSPNDLLWSPDGERVYYGASVDEGGLDLFSKPADGSGDAERLLHLDGNEYPASFTPDGGTLIFEWAAPGRLDSDLFALDLASGTTRPLFAEPYAEALAEISPDGHWIAYTSSESPERSQIVVRRYPELTGKWQVSFDGGAEPHWSPEGEALYFRGNGALHRVAVETRDGFRSSAPELIADSMLRGLTATTYAVARGGRVLLVRSATLAKPLDTVNFDLDLAALARKLTTPKR